MAEVNRWDVLLTLAMASMLTDAFEDDLVVRDLYLIRSALRHASRGVPMMVRLCDAGAELVAAWPLRRTEPLRWSRARYDATQAASYVLRWRAAQLHGLLTAEAGDERRAS